MLPFPTSKLKNFCVAIFLHTLNGEVGFLASLTDDFNKNALLEIKATVSRQRFK